MNAALPQIDFTSTSEEEAKLVDFVQNNDHDVTDDGNVLFLSQCAVVVDSMRVNIDGFNYWVMDIYDIKDTDLSWGFFNLSCMGNMAKDGDIMDMYNYRNTKVFTNPEDFRAALAQFVASECHLD